MIYKIIKYILFLFNPEKAHNITFISLKLVNKIPFVSFFIKKHFSIENPILEREVFGIKFKNPVGLAGGLDKNANCIDELANLGFGFIEIGTVTPLPQSGNPKPRIFRLKKDRAIINRMGFNNQGVDNVIKNLKKTNSNIIIGGNIGKNKITSNENAMYDYEICFQKLYNYVNYFVINVSSPNTPNLRELQEKSQLKKILGHLQELNLKKEKRKPILLKIAPDLSDNQLDDIIEVIYETKIDGVIATNTTILRNNLKESKFNIDKIGNGGLSGVPLKDRSSYVIRYLFEKSRGTFPIVGVGGIDSPQDALDKLNLGASLIQLYTGFIYNGPNLIRDINKLIILKN